MGRSDGRGARGKDQKDRESLARKIWVLRRLVGLAGSDVAREVGVDVALVYRLEYEFDSECEGSRWLLETARQEFLRRFHSVLAPGTIGERLGVDEVWVRGRLEALDLSPADPPRWSSKRVLEAIGRRRREGLKLREGSVLWEEPELYENACRTHGSWRTAVRAARERLEWSDSLPPSPDPGRPRGKRQIGQDLRKRLHLDGEPPADGLVWVMARIERRAVQGASLAAPDVLREDPALLRDANVWCGSWRRALELAGLAEAER